MVSAKFVQLVETNADQTTARILTRLRQDPRAPRISSLPETELRETCHRVLKNLGHWLTASSETELARHYEERGRTRAREGVPLSEAVHLAHLIKETMLDFTRDQGFTQTTIDLCAAEELEHQVGRFFDSAVFHLVRGYEQSVRHAVSAT